MSDLTSPAPTQDERVMAGLAHVSIMIPMMGLIAPVAIWITQKDQSRFVAFQALQALAYQLVMVAAWFLGWGCYVLSFLGMFLILPLSGDYGDSSSLPPLFGLSFFLPFLVMGAVLLGSFLFIAYGIVGAVMAFQGKPFRYAIIGRQVERFMQTGKDNEAIST